MRRTHSHRPKAPDRRLIASCSSLPPHRGNFICSRSARRARTRLAQSLRRGRLERFAQNLSPGRAVVLRRRGSSDMAFWKSAAECWARRIKSYVASPPRISAPGIKGQRILEERSVPVRWGARTPVCVYANTEGLRSIPAKATISLTWSLRTT